jgi:hypothetical protein
VPWPATLAAAWAVSPSQWAEAGRLVAATAVMVSAPTANIRRVVVLRFELPHSAEPNMAISFSLRNE